MATWFNCKIKHMEFVGDKVKQVTKAYLIDAVSFTDAEARLHKACEGLDTFEVASVAKSRIREVYPAEGAANWYKVDLSYVDIHDGKEKEIKIQWLVAANTTDEALATAQKEHAKWLVQCTVNAVALVAYEDVIPYEATQKDI